MYSRRQPSSLPANLRDQPSTSLLATPQTLEPPPHWDAAMLQPDPSRAVDRQPPANREARGTRRTRPQILVVDDESVNLDLIASAVGDEYDLLFARSGRDALTVAKKHLPDLILLDVMMPNMDGFEACTHLKEHAFTHNIPILFITALDDPGFEVIGLELGAVDFIGKPIDPAAVRARVHNQIKLKLALEQATIMAAMETALRRDVLDVLEEANRPS